MQIAARERVKQQIAEDKQRRAEKAAREKELRQGIQTQATPAAQSAPLAAQLPNARSSNSTETRLRVRAPGGMWMGTMSASATLADVEQAVLSDGKGGGATSLTVRFFSQLTQFSTTFPRKTYSAEERSKTLKDLGLIPNAALEAQ